MTSKDGTHSKVRNVVSQLASHVLQKHKNGKTVNTFYLNNRAFVTCQLEMPPTGKKAFQYMSQAVNTTNAHLLTKPPTFNQNATSKTNCCGEHNHDDCSTLDWAACTFTANAWRDAACKQDGVVS
jgi:hypothetical protein